MVAFQEQLDALEAANISVVAASTDSSQNAQVMIEKCRLTFPVAYGLPLEETARRLGAYYELRRRILHATGFLLRPDGTVAVACYSSGAIGRLDPDGVLKLVRFFQRRPG